MWMLITALVIAVAILGRWLWWELREWHLERLAREDQEMWLKQTRERDQMGTRWPRKYEP